MFWLFAAIATAAPDEDFLRVADTPKVARYLKVDGSPARARLKNAKGPYEVWVWRDGRLARYKRWDGKKLLEDARFDAVGDPVATLRYADGVVTEVVVRGRTDANVSIAAWKERAFGAATLVLPPLEHHADGSIEAWPVEGGDWRAVWAPVGDPFSETFRDGLVATCACEVVDRYTVFADGRAGAGYLVRVPGPDAPRLGEVEAFADVSGTLVLAYTAPTGFDPVGVDDPAVRLAPGRAIVALLRWNPPPKERPR